MGILNALAAISAARGEKLSLGIASITTRGGLPVNLTRDNVADWRNFGGQWSGL